jgi:hypothetical protein
MKVQGGVDVQRHSFFNLGARWGVGGQRHAPAALPPGMTRYPMYRRLGGLDGCEKSRSHRDSTPQMVQPVAIRYTGPHKAEMVPQIQSRPLSHPFHYYLLIILRSPLYNPSSWHLR